MLGRFVAHAIHSFEPERAVVGTSAERDGYEKRISLGLGGESHTVALIF